MATCYDCIHCDACSDAGDAGYSSLKEDVTKCKHFKNKADFVMVTRCGKCKHGDVSVFEKPKDGQERVGCFFNITEKVQTLDWYCPVGEPKNDKENNRIDDVYKILTGGNDAKGSD